MLSFDSLESSFTLIILLFHFRVIYLEIYAGQSVWRLDPRFPSQGLRYHAIFQYERIVWQVYFRKRRVSIFI